MYDIPLTAGGLFRCTGYSRVGSGPDMFQARAWSHWIKCFHNACPRGGSGRRKHTLSTSQTFSSLSYCYQTSSSNAVWLSPHRGCSEHRQQKVRSYIRSFPALPSLGGICHISLVIPKPSTKSLAGPKSKLEEKPPPNFIFVGTVNHSFLLKGTIPTVPPRAY